MLALKMLANTLAIPKLVTVVLDMLANISFKHAC